MRWTTEKPAGPIDGAHRTIERFAWLPIALGDGMTVWLEWYDVEQVYRYNGALAEMGWHQIGSRVRRETLADYI